MGLESLPHLALGNTQKGMTQIVMSPNQGGYSYSDWLGTQKDELMEAAYQHGRRSVAKHVSETNALCYASRIHAPSVKSLEYFSEFENISGSVKKEQKLLAVKNPVGFGALVYSATKTLVSKFGAKVSYYAPSEFVGLELAEKGLLDRSKFHINYNSQDCTNYADNFEYELRMAAKNIEAISAILECLDTGALKSGGAAVNKAISDVLEAYHSSIGNNVRKGLSYTVIEDAWLAKRVRSSQKLANQLLVLYRYAERHKIQFDTKYPRYNDEDGVKCMKNSVDRLTIDHYALYSEIFTLIKAKAICSSAGKKYQLGYIIPQMQYITTINKDLSNLLKKLNSMNSLNRFLYGV